LAIFSRATRVQFQGRRRSLGTAEQPFPSTEHLSPMRFQDRLKADFRVPEPALPVGIPALPSGSKASMIG
jgi:hypothetical protein